MRKTTELLMDKNNIRKVGMMDKNFFKKGEEGNMMEF